MHLLRELQDWPLGQGWLLGGPVFLRVLWSAGSVALTVRLTECDCNCDCACDCALPRWYGEGQVGAEQLCVAAPVFGDSAYYS